jgi:hypothetical protein
MATREFRHKAADNVEIDYETGDVVESGIIVRATQLRPQLVNFVSKIEFELIGPHYRFLITTTDPARNWNQELIISSGGRLENYDVPEYFQKEEVDVIRSFLTILADGVRIHEITRVEVS